MNKPLDPTKPVQTRDGHKARIICTDAKGDQPVIALITSTDDTLEYAQHHSLDGTYWLSGGDGLEDLVNVAEETVEWVNYYGEDQESVVHSSIEQADAYQAKITKRQALLKVTKVDGKVTKVEVL